MCIATATPEGRPSNRMVLMKGYDQRGFKFYSNYSSRKGQELERNSYASLCFWWEPLHRSVGLFPKFLQSPAAHAVFCAGSGRAASFGSILPAAVADLVCCQLHDDCYSSFVGSTIVGYADNSQFSDTFTMHFIERLFNLVRIAGTHRGAGREAHCCRVRCILPQVHDHNSNTAHQAFAEHIHAMLFTLHPVLGSV